MPGRVLGGIARWGRERGYFASDEDLATTLITLLEGAQVLCRADGTLRPYDRTVRTALALVPD